VLCTPAVQRRADLHRFRLKTFRPEIRAALAQYLWLLARALTRLCLPENRSRLHMRS
jgi:hypothetical protein